MARINDIAIDLGTSTIQIYMKGTGIVLQQPAVVAIEKDSRKILALGTDAYRMMERTPSHVTTVKPLEKGSMMDSELLDRMLREYVGTVIGKRLFARPRAVISVPTGVNEPEKRAIISSLFDAGMRRTQLLDKPVAAALGVGLHFWEPYGNMLIDMSSGVADIAVLSMGSAVVVNSHPGSGDAFDDAIARFLRRKYNLLIGKRTAEELKINYGTAIAPAHETTFNVTGRNLISGLPKMQQVTNTDLYEALREPIMQLVEAIQSTIERTPSQLVTDIFDDGMVLTGGAALLNGLPQAIYDAMHIPCMLADEPQTCVLYGCAKALDDPNGMRTLLSNGRRNWIRV